MHAGLTKRISMTLVILTRLDKQVLAIENRRLLFIGILMLLIVVATVFVGARFLTNRLTDKPGTLESVEIREYQGQKLSSTTDFRENSIKGPQFMDNKSYRLTVTGLVNNGMVYTYDDVVNNHQHYEKVVTLYCLEGWDVTILWEGVLLKDLLGEVGIKPTVKIVIFYASDGYSTFLPLDYIISNICAVA